MPQVCEAEETWLCQICQVTSSYYLARLDSWDKTNIRKSNARLTAKVTRSERDSWKPLRTWERKYPLQHPQSWRPKQCRVVVLVAPTLLYFLERNPIEKSNITVSAPGPSFSITPTSQMKKPPHSGVGWQGQSGDSGGARLDDIHFFRETKRYSVE